MKLLDAAIPETDPCNAYCQVLIKGKRAKLEQRMARISFQIIVSRFCHAPILWDSCRIEGVQTISEKLRREFIRMGRNSLISRANI